MDKTMTIGERGVAVRPLSDRGSGRPHRTAGAGGFQETLQALLEPQPAARRPASLGPSDLAALRSELARNVPPPAETAPVPAQGGQKAGGTVEYTVRPGDTLWRIGREHGNLDPRQIARDNGIADPNRIHPGQRLRLRVPDPPPPAPSLSGVVKASWYGAEHHRKPTASGEPFDMFGHTLAHRTLPLGTRVRMVNPANGRVAEGVVNDRGPFVPGRELDVSYALARRLGFVRQGVVELQIETLPG